MKIYFSNVGARRFYVKRLLNGALAHLGQPSAQMEMSLSIVSQEEIKGLNGQFRGVDAVTDVLSFPTTDNPTRAILNLQTNADIVNPDSGKLNVGDVVICLDRAMEQAHNYGHSLKRELAFLSLHGLLHLLGYDHVEPHDEQQMNALQDKILTKLNFTRND